METLSNLSTVELSGLIFFSLALAGTVYAIAGIIIDKLRVSKK